MASDRLAELRRRVEQAAAVAEVLESPALAQVVERQRRKYFDAWAKSTPSDTHGREEAYRMHRALDDLLREMRAAVDDGALAREEIKRIERYA